MDLVADLLVWIEPRALLLALLLPPVIRIVGHWIPEELFMVSMGVLAARSGSPAGAITLLGAVLVSHFATDQVVFLIGRWLRPRLARWPQIGHRLARATARLETSPTALLGLVPARVLPLGRGAWLAGCGVVGIGWRRFAAVDLGALVVHVLVWCGFGWWLADDLRRLQLSVDIGAAAGGWLVMSAAAAVAAVFLWRRRTQWQPVSEWPARRAGRAARRPRD